MAESGVSGSGTGSNPRFFCHECNTQFSQVLDDFTCPSCKGGFIEDITNSGSESLQSRTDSGPSFNSSEMLMATPGSTSGQGFGGSGSGASVRFPPASYHRTRSADGSSEPTNHSFSFVYNMPGGAGGSSQNVNSENPQNPMEHVLFNFLTDLVSGLGGGGGTLGGLAGNVPGLGNIGDYVFGQNGLDQIVTQLMNQMEGTGPAPLAADKIDTLPDVIVNQDQVDRKLQCSVCWDDFALNEPVKQLECDHLYHPDCIIPWLKLHGTCPICRKDLTGQVENDPKSNPSARFEADSTSSPSLSSNNSESSNTSANPRQQSHLPTSPHSAFQTFDPNQTAVNLFSQFFNPLLQATQRNAQGPGHQGHPQHSTNPSPNPSGQHPQQQPGSGAATGSASGQQPPQQPPSDNQRRGPGPGFDNMDLDFD